MIHAEHDDFDLSGQETVKTGPFGDIPILIRTHDAAVDVADGLAVSLIQAGWANQKWTLEAL